MQLNIELFLAALFGVVATTPVAPRAAQEVGQSNPVHSLLANRWRSCEDILCRTLGSREFFCGYRRCGQLADPERQSVHNIWVWSEVLWIGSAMQRGYRAEHLQWSKAIHPPVRYIFTDMNREE